MNLKNILFASVMSILAFSAAPSYATDEAIAAIDAPAPNFVLPAANGNTYNLSDFKGNTVVLEWFNKDCPFVRKHYDTRNMQDLQKEYAEKGVIWLSIISSAEGKQGYLTAEEAIEVKKAEDAHPTHILLDPKGDVGQLYNAKTTPHMFVINPEGVLVYAGAIDNKPNAVHADARMARNYVREALDAVLGGQEVADKSTIPYGCSVKY